MGAANRDPEISLGLPVYNGEEYLAGTIESLLSQTYQDFELIISDNASTDGTQDICEEFAKRDSRIRYDRLASNLGAAPNYNRIVPDARGHYFKWQAHDDRCYPEFLAECLSAMRADPEVVLAYPSTHVIDAKGDIMSEYRDDLALSEALPSERLVHYLRVNFLRKQGMCNPIFGLIKTAELRKTRLIQDFLASDRLLLAHLSLLGKFVELPGMLFQRRVHLGTSTMVDQNFAKRAAWFNRSADAKNALFNNHVTLRMTHFRDLYRAINELVEDPQERRSCQLALTKAATTDVRWLWRDIKYSLGYQPKPKQILEGLRT